MRAEILSIVPLEGEVRREGSGFRILFPSLN